MSTDAREKARQIAAQQAKKSPSKAKPPLAPAWRTRRGPHHCRYHRLRCSQRKQE